MEKNLAIILAGGSGTRFGKRIPKQFSRMGNRTVLEYSIDTFDKHPAIDAIYLIVHPEFQKKAKGIIRKNNYKKIKKILTGGKTRQESVYCGIMAAGPEIENVFIHDSVRPMVSRSLIDELLKNLGSYSAVTAAIPPSDTIASVDNQNRIIRIPDRNSLRRLQTPQAFKLKIIKKAHERAKLDQVEDFSDDCSLVLHFKLADVLAIIGSENNIKVTHPLDLLLVKKLVK